MTRRRGVNMRPRKLPDAGRVERAPRITKAIRDKFYVPPVLEPGHGQVIFLTDVDHAVGVSRWEIWDGGGWQPWWPGSPVPVGPE